MKRSVLIASLAAFVFPALAWADCGSCGSPCKAEKPCSPCAKKVKCCEKVKICEPVQREHCRLVKDTCCVPKTHTKCVKDKCDPCGGSHMESWTTYHQKCSYRWEKYCTTEYKTRYIKRCGDQMESARATPIAGESVASAN